MPEFLDRIVHTTVQTLVMLEWSLSTTPRAVKITGESLNDRYCASICFGLLGRDSRRMFLWYTVVPLNSGPNRRCRPDLGPQDHIKKLVRGAPQQECGAVIVRKT
jgi:hypothetical protein